MSDKFDSSEDPTKEFREHIVVLEQERDEWHQKFNAMKQLCQNAENYHETLRARIVELRWLLQEVNFVHQPRNRVCDFSLGLRSRIAKALNSTDEEPKP